LAHFRTHVLQQLRPYSMTSSARASSVAGSSISRDLAVLRLIARSCSIDLEAISYAASLMVGPNRMFASGYPSAGDEQSEADGNVFPLWVFRSVGSPPFPYWRDR
jgi:hypothetical protein